MSAELNEIAEVSVIVPTYNSAQYICETLDSVLAQTYKGYEIIVVDDGSTDNTKEVLQPYMSKIRYTYKKNGGPASARNVGIKNARGRYIALLDSDDLWLPKKLGTQIKHFQENPHVGLVYSDCIRFTEDGMCQRRSEIHRPAKGHVFFKLLQGNFIPNSTVVAKRECFEQVGYFDEDINLMSSEDYDMWLRISRIFAMDYVEEPLMKYRIRKEGLARSNTDRICNARLRAFTKAIKNVENEFLVKDKFIKGCLFQLFLKWGLAHFTNDNFRESRKQFATAIKYKHADLKTIVYYLATFLPGKSIKALRKVKGSLS